MAEGGQIVTTKFDPLNPGASHKPSLGKQLVVVGSLLILLLGSIIWGVRLNPPSSSARAPALAVSKGDVAELQALADDAAAPAARAPATALSESAAVQVAGEEDTKDEPTEHVVEKGDTLIKIAKRYGKDWKELCLENKLEDCHDIRPGQKLSLVVGDATLARMNKVGKRFFVPKDRYQLVDCSKTKLGYCVFSRPGGDPVCKKSDQIAVLARDLEIPKETAKKWTTAAKERKLIKAGTFIDGLSFGHGYWKGRVLVKQDMWANVGEIDGKWVGQFELCCNFFPMTPPPVQEPPPVEPPPQVEPPVQEPPVVIPPEKVEPPVVQEPPPKVEPPVTPPPQPPQEEEALWNYDRDLTVYAGGDRDVRFAGAEGAFYPALFYYSWGRYAIGIGGFGNFWEGATPDDYHFGGRYGALGLAQKLSTWDGRDWGLKLPMIGAFAEHGHNKSGFYREEREAKLWCAALSYNDATREKRGETKLPEWQLWASYCDPFSQTKSRTVFGQSVDSSSMADVRYILGVGGRVFLSKDLTDVFGKEGIAAKLQPFLELGFNKTAPNPFSAHFYGGLRTVNKVVGCGVGVHHSEAGTIPGATCTYDVGRHLWLHDKEERWAEMVKSLEALGVTVDE